ncbi:MAG: SpoIVB peptidase S55 domain-containing protein [Clostridia bacterium]
MNKKTWIKIAYTLFVALIVGCVFCAVVINNFDLYGINNNLTISETSTYLNPPKPLVAKVENCNENFNNSKINYSLFGAIPLKTIDCNITTNNSAFLGGFPIGIKMQSDEMIINSKVNVVTKDGLRCPFEQYEIQFGDILYSINNIRISNVKILSKVIEEMDGLYAKVVIMRGNVQINCDIMLAEDCVEKTKKLGLMLQDSITGLGTMTFVDCNSLRYGALGHPVKDINDNAPQNIGGQIFDAKIFGATIGEKGKAGELNGNFNAYENAIGDIKTHSKFGIFGNFVGNTSNMKKIEFGDRYSVKPGKAYIYSSIGSGIAQKYEIEIIKVNTQNYAKDKGMVLRIVDKTLLSKCGGIVQGMSGSPIVQNNKLIGAVTHVFLNDSSKGYGLFVDWMR